MNTELKGIFLGPIGSLVC